MIFDERDLDEEEINEENKKSYKPQKNQLNMDDLIKSTPKKEEVKKVEKKETSTKKESTSKTKATKSTSKKEKTILNFLDDESAEETFEAIDELVSQNNENEEEVETQAFESTFTIDDDGNYLKDISKVYHDSMIPYSEHVILDRAIPRVEDGLKPVQRRILYSMYELGVTPDKPYKKSAKTVGDVISNYHPHGDSSIYNAMVHMAQKFNMREALIDGHGNFGSVDGDGAAAMRYTESRLAPLSLEILRDIEKNTVRWAKTYDDSRDEPEMLPSRFPNILVNGATGIAVGLATNIPTHNLGECIDACVELIDKPNATTEELMKYLKGPDFPTGGIILGTDGIKQAYETGKAKILIRAKTHIETDKQDKKTIVITEFPYQVNKAQLLYKIAELKEKYKDVLSCIADIRDESDRQGIRAVVCLKKDADADMVLNFLFKYTDLQTSYGINMVAIADGKPRLMGIKQILSYYVNFQREVVLNRTKYDLEAAEERANIVEGLLIAIQNIDEVIKIIKTSASTTEARINLCKTFNLNEKQAQAILDMRLARLTNLEVYKLEEELASLKKLISELKAIVKSEKLQMGIVKKEMLEIKKKYATKRLTEIVGDASAYNLEDKLESLKPVKDVYIAVNEKNCIKKMYEKGFMTSSRCVSKTSTINEVHNIILKTKTDTTLLLLTKSGLCYKVEQDNILEARWKDRGSMLNDVLLGFDSKDKVLFLDAYKDKLPNYDIVLITNLGNIKRINTSELDVKKQGIAIAKLKEDEYIVSIQKYEKGKTMLFVSKSGLVLNCNIEDVPATTRTTGLLKGMSLNQDDYVVGGGLVTKNDLVLMCTEKAFVKKVKVEEFGELVRNRKGLKGLTLSKESGEIVMLAEVIKDTFEVMALTDKDKAYSINTDNVALENRTTKGKIVDKLLKTEKVKKIYKYSWN